MVLVVADESRSQELFQRLSEPCSQKNRFGRGKPKEQQRDVVYCECTVRGIVSATDDQPSKSVKQARNLLDGPD